jgi:hypothetical protein
MPLGLQVPPTFAAQALFAPAPVLRQSATAAFARRCFLRLTGEISQF